MASDDPKYLASGFVRCTCHAVVNLKDIARSGQFGTCHRCGRLFDWPKRKAESKAQLQRRRRAERDRQPTLF